MESQIINEGIFSLEIINFANPGCLLKLSWDSRSKQCALRIGCTGKRVEPRIIAFEIEFDDVDPLDDSE